MLSQGEAAVVSWYEAARRGAARARVRKDKRESLPWKYSAQCSVHARALTTHVQEEQKKRCKRTFMVCPITPYFHSDALLINSNFVKIKTIARYLSKFTLYMKIRI